MSPGYLLKGVRRCPTLPHTPVCSTIGAEGLSFRVRYETGRFPLRYDRRNSMKLFTNPNPETGGGRVVVLFQNHTVDANALYLACCGVKLLAD